MKKKIVGFFGGSFDPLHNGHISLAIDLCEIHHLDQVLFCPATCSPFRTSTPPFASPEHRLKMLELAIEEIPRFAVTPIEIHRKGPSYTIDTLRALSEELGPSVQLRLILSDESAAHLHRWKETEELIRLAPPLIGTRNKLSSLPGLTQTRILDISSTDVRERLEKNLYCGHLVPHKVLEYIEQHRLFSLRKNR